MDTQISLSELSHLKASQVQWQKHEPKEHSWPPDNLMCSHTSLGTAVGPYSRLQGQHGAVCATPENTDDWGKCTNKVTFPNGFRLLALLDVCKGDIVSKDSQYI